MKKLILAGVAAVAFVAGGIVLPAISSATAACEQAPYCYQDDQPCYGYGARGDGGCGYGYCRGSRSGCRGGY